MAARAAAGRQFLVELRPSFARWLPASLDLHTWTFQGFLRSSWVELIVVVMVRVMEEGEGELTAGVWPPEASIPSPQTSPATPFGPDAQVVWGQVGRFKDEFLRK